MAFRAIVIILLVLGGQAHAELVTLSTGEVLKAQVTRQNGETVTLVHPVLGTLTLPAASVTSIALQPDAAAPPAAPEKPAKATPAKKPQPPAKNGFFANWDGQFELGFSATQGNSETTHMLMRLKAKKQSERHRWIADSAYYLSRDQDKTTKNEFAAGLLKDWLIPDSPWFYYAQARYEYDEFEAWEQRIRGAAGVGYQLFKSDKLDVLLRAGAGGNHEFGEVDEFTPEAQLGGELAWKLTDSQSIEASTYYYPNLGDWPESRIESTLGWRVKIDQLDGVSLKVGLENEYESRTEDDSKHNDVKVFSSVVFEF